MAELLIELFSEEIPARMQNRALDDLKRLFAEKLKAAGFDGLSMDAYATPRRLAVRVDGLPDAQPDTKEERRGPRVGAPEQALAGFLKSTGLAQSDLEQRTTPKGDFYYAVIEAKGRATRDVLAEIMPTIIAALPWQKSMKWADHTARWVRPLHNILCLFDGAVVDFKWEHLASNGVTYGHRFMAPAEIAVKDFADYQAKLKAAHVVLDGKARADMIAADAALLAKGEGLSLIDDPALLTEVAGLVEWPECLLGRIDAKFMEVPSEVLISAMRSHQKYFSLAGSDGKMAPWFITVANLRAEDGGAKITNGNERVLSARLSDAKFFWDQDQKIRLEDRVDALEKIIFHARLGTVREKTDRVMALCGDIAPYVPGADVDDCRRAALLSKADLSTEMVGEFADLQGLMGRYYATLNGEKPAIAAAIEEHYSPLGPGDACPSAPVSVVVALAEKIDILVGFFAIDEKPTGSKDPYALRRAALGVIRLILENGIRIPLAEIFGAANSRLVVEGSFDAGELLHFFADRLKVHLKERHVRHDHIAAVFALGNADDLVRLMAQVEALSGFLGTDDGANLLVAYRRAANILRIEEKKDGVSYDAAPDAAGLVEESEKQLFARIGEVAGLVAGSVAQDEFETAAKAAATLRKPVDDFFDTVVVNADDPALRVNRLKLLSRIRNGLDQLADFSKIEG